MESRCWAWREAGARAPASSAASAASTAPVLFVVVLVVVTVGRRVVVSWIGKVPVPPWGRKLNWIGRRSKGSSSGRGPKRPCPAHSTAPIAWKSNSVLPDWETKRRSVTEPSARIAK